MAPAPDAAPRPAQNPGPTEAVTPETSPVDGAPLRGDAVSYQQEQALTASVQRYVSNLSDGDVLAVGSTLAQDANLDPQTAKRLREAVDASIIAREGLRGSVVSTLTGGTSLDESGAQARALDKFNKVIDGASNEQLVTLFRKAYGEGAEIPGDRDALREALTQKDAFERLLSDPSASADIAQLMLNSGVLSADERAALSRAFSQYQESMKILRDAVVEALIERLLQDGRNQYAPQLTLRRDPHSLSLQNSDQGNQVDTGGVIELLAEDALGGPNHFEQDAAIVRGVAEAVRKRDEAIEARRTEDDQRDDRLRQAIEDLKRENAPLMASMFGSRLEQLQYQDPLEHPDKLSLQRADGEVYLFTEGQEAARRRAAA